jgi:hypothetical protein
MMKKVLLLFFAVSFFSFSPAVLAQGDSLALSVTPPLVNINLTPGQEIALDVTVVNNNDRPLKVYIEAVDFRDRGNGVELFRDQAISEDPGVVNMYLSRWITLSKDEVEVGPYRAEKVPFVISVPQGANPGGHYAALLIGPGAPDKKGDGAVVKVTSKISSLILARVEGKVDERGMIREFSPIKSLSSKADVGFKVRFENLGNIHLRPQGVIKVYDMFGKQKGGDVEFNYKKDYGNVLPGGDREWENIAWHDDDFFLFNRYKAELSMSFGEEAKQTDNRYAFFWVIDWKWLFSVIVILAIFIISLFLFVKFYVKQSVKNLQREFGVAPSRSSALKPRTSSRARRTGTVDLRKIKKDE